MSKLDPQAKRVAIDRFRDTVRAGQKEKAAIAEAINAYRQAECKPFKDAPRDGTVVEAWDKLGDSWRNLCWTSSEYENGDSCWRLLETGSTEFTREEGVSYFSHYRIPFNPEEG